MEELVTLRQLRRLVPSEHCLVRPTGAEQSMLGQLLEDLRKP